MSQKNYIMILVKKNIKDKERPYLEKGEIKKNEIYYLEDIIRLKIMKLI